MKLKLYDYGMENVLVAIGNALESALNTNDKIKRTKYISEALGMVEAAEILIQLIENKEDKKENKEDEHHE